MSRWLACPLLCLLLATGAGAAESPQNARTEEALQRYNAGVGALARGDQEYALYQFRQAIRLNPDLADAHHNLGVALLGMRQPSQAAEEFTRGVGFDAAIMAIAGQGTNALSEVASVMQRSPRVWFSGFSPATP